MRIIRQLRRMVLISAAAAMLSGFAGCGGLSDPISGGGSILESQNEVTADTTEKPEVPEGAIVDESGDFVYTGKLQQVGDDENGYIQVPLGYVQFQEMDVSGLTQYSDTTGTNIVTLEYYEGINYQIAADSMLSYVQSDENFQDVRGATVKVAGYDALQLYGRYSDGIILVVWFIEDPADTANSYYLSIEFDNDHSYLIACSSTFQTVEDYHAGAPETE